MKLNTLISGLATTSLLTAVHARPEWLQRKHKIAREYNVYDTESSAHGYSYGGYGPPPTLSGSVVPSSSTTSSETSAEATSSSKSWFSYRSIRD